MKMYLSLAWRNIWRNRRRSLISIASVVLAVVVALFMRSFQLGFYSHSINNVVSYYNGYIQLHAPGYWEKKSLDRSFAHDSALAAMVEATERITATAPRLEVFALVSAGERTDGALISGISPEHESAMIGLDRRVTSGRYLDASDPGIMLAEGLADHLGVGVSDTVVILGQGYHGVTAAGKYPVIGIVTFPVPEMNRGLAYLSLPQAQYLTAADDRLTTLAIMIDDQRHLEAVTSALQSRIGQRLEVMTWQEMMPELVQLIETDNAGGIIMIFVVYMVIGFGILGTVLMMTVERTREFGMLMAVGMRRSFLALVVTMESVILSFIGVIIGAVLGLPMMLYFYHHPIRLTGELAEATISYGFEPIWPMSLDPMIFFWQSLTILIIAIIAAAYPLWRIAGLDAVAAMRTG
jgi:ABC-type lipoprotein release transport system permease subunit